MASTASPSIQQGVAPLRAGQGHSFLLRRLHSLSGIVPVGLFLIEHFISNAFATRGPGAYAKQVELLSGFPFVFYLELFGIWLPILYHSLYGFYIWYRGETNVGDYPWMWHLRFTGVHILMYPGAAFGKVQGEFQHTWAVVFYAAGILCASWHFAYGLWLFAAKWGITTGDGARRKFAYVCFAIGLLFVLVGALTMRAFLTTPLQPCARSKFRLSAISC